MEAQTAHVDDSVDRLVIVSDLHAYREPLAAFEECLAALPGRSQVCVDGDLFEGGIDPAETVSWVRKHAEGFAARGNHDAGVLGERLDGDFPPDTERGAYAKLNADQIRFLRELPDALLIQWRGRSIRMMHGHRTPSGQPGHWLWVPDESMKAFGDASVDLTVVAHTHFPFIMRLSGGLLANTGSLSVPIVEVRMADGSVHYQSGDERSPANGDFRSSFLSVTEAAGGLEVEIVRFDYDREAALRRLLRVKGSYSAVWKERLLREGVADLPNAHVS